MFTVAPVPWTAPEAAKFDALILTSANAARHGGDQLASLSPLPCYAVGEATAEAAREAGLSDIRTGPSDGSALVTMVAAEGVRRALHLCGRDHEPLRHTAVRIESRIVYASDAEEGLPSAALQALGQGAVPLIHSPRAARIFSALADRAGIDRSAIRLAAISPAAAQAAGEGWASAEAAAYPRDEALLELAAKLCQTERGVTGKFE